MQVTLSRVSGWMSPITNPWDEATKITLYSLPSEHKDVFHARIQRAGKLVDLVEQLDLLFQGDVIDGSFYRVQVMRLDARLADRHRRFRCRFCAMYCAVRAAISRFSMVISSVYA